MELVIYNPTDDQFIKTIEFNYDEIKNELEVRLEHYRGLTYTDNDIKSAKTDRATLNKFKDALENKRKEVKKQILTPYEQFEKQIKQLVGMVDDANNNIDTQIKNYEQAIKDAKLEEIKTFFNDNIGGLKDIVSFDSIFSQKWLNSSVNMKSIQEEITSTLAKITADLAVINDLKSEFEVSIKNAYMRNYDLSEALREKTRLEELKEKESQRQQHAKRQEEIKHPEPITAAPVQEIKAEEKLERIEFVLYVTQAQKQMLKQFLINNNFKVRKD